MMFEVGERWGMERELCRGGSEEEIERNCGFSVLPGAIYEVVYVLEQPIKREDLPKMYSLLRDLESRYAEVGVNYIGVSDDGRQVIFQFFDPIPQIVWEIAALVLVFLILYFGVPRAAQAIVSILPPMPEGAKPVIGALFWAGVSATLIGGGLYMASKAFGRRGG
jgi:hypothetical protein